VQKSHETIPTKDEPLLATGAADPSSLHLRIESSINDQSSISAFDKILKDSANVPIVKGQGSKAGSVMSGSRQKNRKNKVILPKIMFYKQSPSVRQPDGIVTSQENSGRLISLDRLSTAGD